jgi:hypothetical protein
VSVGLGGKEGVPRLRCKVNKKINGGGGGRGWEGLAKCFSFLLLFYFCFMVKLGHLKLGSTRTSFFLLRLWRRKYFGFRKRFW